MGTMRPEFPIHCLTLSVTPPKPSWFTTRSLTTAVASLFDSATIYSTSYLPRLLLPQQCGAGRLEMVAGSAERTKNQQIDKKGRMRDWTGAGASPFKGFRGEGGGEVCSLRREDKVQKK